MEFRSVSRNCVREWYILRGIWLLIVAGAFVGFCFIPTADRADEIGKGAFLIVWGMFTLWMAVYALVFPVLQYNRLKYRVDAQRIEKHSGVIFLRKAYVPFVKIQHTEVYRGIFDRIFNMATVIVFTAGSFIRITNLDTEQADDLVSHIRKLIEESAVEVVND